MIFAGDVEIKRALEAGARAYILKSMPPSELLDVIRQVHAGKKRIPSEIAAYLAEHYSDECLTTREVEILGQLAQGNRNRDIAEKLFISEETVKAHLKHIMEKLGANDRRRRLPSALAGESFSFESSRNPKADFACLSAPPTSNTEGWSKLRHG